MTQLHGEARHRIKSSDIEDGAIYLLSLDLATPLNLRSLIPSRIDTFSAVFCNFAIHYFFSSEDAMDTLLRNVVPLLSQDASFVIIFMDEASVRKEMPIVIREQAANTGPIEFSITYTTDCTDTVDVFIRSIGMQHIERLVNIADIREKFEPHGLFCREVFSFEELEALSTPTKLLNSSFSDLSIDEKRISLISSSILPGWATR